MWRWGCLAIVVLLPGASAAQAPAAAPSVGRAQQAYVQAVELMDAGKITEAIQAAQRAVTLWEALPGDHAEDLASALLLLGTWQFDAEHYAEASNALIRAGGLLHQHPKSEELAVVQLTLGRVYEKTGAPLEAEGRFHSALETLKGAPGPHTRAVATTTLELAQILYRRRDLKRAEELARRSLALSEGDPHAKPTDVGPPVSLLGLILQEKRAYGEAEVLLRRALNVAQAAPHPDALAVAACMTNLASVLAARQQFADAEEQASRALELYGQAKYSGADAVTALDILVLAMWGQGDMDQALRFHALGTQMQELAMAPILRVGTAAQKTTYVSSTRSRLDTAVTMHLRAAPNSAQAARGALTALLNFKGRALDASASGVRQLLALDIEAVRTRFVRMLDARRALASFRLRIPPASLLQSAYQTQEFELRSQIDVIERTLNEHLGVTTETLPSATVDRVAAALPRDTALIEFCVFWPADPHKSAGVHEIEARYAAYVLLADGTPRAVELGPVSAIDALVARARTALGTNGAEYKPAVRAVFAKLMRPVLPLLAGATEVFVAPDGQLNLLPMAALIDDDGDFLLRRYHFTYLTTGRDLLRFGHRDAPRSGPVVYAAPQYDTEHASPAVAGTDRAPRLASPMYFPPLPGTVDEARVLSDVLRLPADAVRTGTAATEDSLVNVHGPAILHLATHGFLLGDASAPANGTRGFKIVATRASATKAADPFDDPLMRSGIALAGANRQAGKLDDGIVTALELTGIDLRGTQLVTLSACDTGLGSVRAGDGIYGLRRALVVAGSESQLTTLWEVADGQTTLLMADYYGRLTRGEGRSEALRQAQIALLGKHPYYWAAFIVSGDPRPLRGALGPRQPAVPPKS